MKGVWLLDARKRGSRRWRTLSLVRARNVCVVVRRPRLRPRSPPKVLVFHGAPTPPTTPGSRPSRRSAPRTASPSTRPRTRRRSTAANLANYRAVVFLNSAGDRLNAAQEGALQALRPGRRRLRRHRLHRGGRDRQHVLHRPDRCASRRQQLDGHDRPGRRRSATGCTPRRVISRSSGRATTSGTVDHAPDGHGPHASRATARPAPPAGDGTDHGRHRLADLLVP